MGCSTQPSPPGQWGLSPSHTKPHSLLLPLENTQEAPVMAVQSLLLVQVLVQ